MIYQFGSTLIKTIFPDFRNPRDRDYVTNNPYFATVNSQENKPTVETYYIPFSPDREMTADEIYTVKVSHAIYDISWQKHMSDIRFLQIKGCKVDKALLSELRDFWRTVHTNGKHSRFDFSAKDDIFNDEVDRKIDHDKLHLLFNPELMYKKFCNGYIPDEEKWNSLDAETKDIICFEEAYVISLERFYTQLPKNAAYNKGQNLLVTKLHPLFIADYVIENWSKLYIPERDYYEIYKRNSFN